MSKSRSSSSLRAMFLGASLVAIAACVVVQDLGATGESVDGGDGATPDDATTVEGGTDGGGLDVVTDGASDDGRAGPGPFGALPTGYCCTNDEQCRQRHCLPSDAGRMCFDECNAQAQGFCDRPFLDFRCDLGQPEYQQTCIPQEGEAFTCLPPSQFVAGTKAAGECCASRPDNLHGQECASNLCIQKRDGPWACTRICEAGVDCPTDWSCIPQIYWSICVPNGLTYTCK